MRWLRDWVREIMSKHKDISEKKFFANNDTFAELFNALVLNDTGLKIDPDDLEDARARSVYVPLSRDDDDEDSVREQERDVAKFWKKGNVILCLMGVESQSTIDKIMPIRVFSYEGADYRTQVVERDEAAREASQNGNKALAKAIRQKKFYPVITVVIYYGTKRRWRKNKSLLECLDIPPELDGLIEDRHINVIELAWLSDEKERGLKSDLRFLVNALKQMRLTGRYNPKSLYEVRHVEDALRVLQALTGHDKLFEEAILKYQEGGKKHMIDFVGGMFREGLYQGEIKGEIKGRAEGMAQGIAQGKKEEASIASKAFAKGLELFKKIGASPEDIAKFQTLYPIQNQGNNS